MEWFEEWFDSPLYQQLYANRNEEEAAELAQLIVELIPPGVYPRILDLGCGRGRHALSLAGHGYRVKGIDLSAEAVEHARQKALERGVENVSFEVGDMRVPLQERFDAVVNLFTTFGYFEEDEENVTVLRSIHSMLREEGLFLIDYMNAEWVERNVVPEEAGRFRDLEYEIHRFIRNDVIYKEITFSGETLDTPVRYREQVKLYDLEWFLERFNEEGFDVLKLLGDYKGNSYHPHHCSRMVLLTRKKSL